MATALLSGRGAPLLLLAASAGALAAALGLQYLGGVEPCVLCHYQRYPYLLVIGASLAALALRGAVLRPWLMVLCGAAFAAGVGVAVYHVGVEQGWFAATAACSEGGGAATVDELRAKLLGTPVARCDEIAWSLFGVSLAGYNVVASMVLASVSLAAAYRGSRRRAA